MSLHRLRTSLLLQFMATRGRGGGGGECVWGGGGEWGLHTPSTAFRHLPPNSARFGYATERALFISAQLSTDAVSVPRKVRVLIKPDLNWALS